MAAVVRSTSCPYINSSGTNLAPLQLPALSLHRNHDQHDADDNTPILSMILNALRAPLRTTTPILLRRNLATSTLKSPVLASKHAPILRHSTFPKPTAIALRSIASQVSGRPGSQTIEHAAENIREEVGNSTADLAKTIAGGNYFADAVKPSGKETFVSLSICLNLNLTHLGALVGNHQRCCACRSSTVHCLRSCWSASIPWFDSHYHLSRPPSR